MDIPAEVTPRGWRLAERQNTIAPATDTVNTIAPTPDTVNTIAPTPDTGTRSGVAANVSREQVAG